MRTTPGVVAANLFVPPAASGPAGTHAGVEPESVAAGEYARLDVTVPDETGDPGASSEDLPQTGGPGRRRRGRRGAAGVRR